MKISKLIIQLEKIKAEHGDLECCSMGVDDGLYSISEANIIKNCKFNEYKCTGSNEKVKEVNMFSDGNETIVEL